MQVRKLSISEFDRIFSEIEKNFIPDERRDYPEAKARFESGEYDVLEFSSDGIPIGFITVWNFSDFVFLEHFVIYEEYRNHGYGSLALAELKSLFPKMILEAEPPFGGLQARRLAFYRRNGFFENEKKYLQPSYRDGGNEVPLVIMSYPEVLDDFDRPISLIKRKVYQK